ncbi:TRAP transporter large permease subunit [archaeon]|nr:MAG: TRAP transporter large permease subunit [archaeon]
MVSSVGALPKPLTFYSLFPLFIFMTMLVLVASEYISMCPAALTVTAVYFMGGWIKPDDIPKMVDIRLLMLMGTSLSFATAMTKSGLALKIAEQINNSNPSNFGALLLVYAITLVITHLISNNATAALMYPVGTALADELGVSFKPFAMCVLFASTAGFMSPIGYQTHVMVWGPGGYRFRDFMIFGFVPNLIYWFIACGLIPLLYPF